MTWKYYECRRCGIRWSSAFDGDPIITLPLYDPFKTKCPRCKRKRHPIEKDTDSGGGEGAAID
jgi:hypothetical protein